MLLSSPVSSLYAAVENPFIYSRKVIYLFYSFSRPCQKQHFFSSFVLRSKRLHGRGSSAMSSNPKECNRHDVGSSKQAGNSSCTWGTSGELGSGNRSVGKRGRRADLERKEGDTRMSSSSNITNQKVWTETLTSCVSRSRSSGRKRDRNSSSCSDNRRIGHVQGCASDTVRIGCFCCSTSRHDNSKIDEGERLCTSRSHVRHCRRSCYGLADPKLSCTGNRKEFFYETRADTTGHGSSCDAEEDAVCEVCVACMQSLFSWHAPGAPRCQDADGNNPLSSARKSSHEYPFCFVPSCDRSDSPELDTQCFIELASRPCVDNCLVSPGLPAAPAEVIACRCYHSLPLLPLSRRIRFFLAAPLPLSSSATAVASAMRVLASAISATPPPTTAVERHRPPHIPAKRRLRERAECFYWAYCTLTAAIKGVLVVTPPPAETVSVSASPEKLKILPLATRLLSNVCSFYSGSTTLLFSSNAAGNLSSSAVLQLPASRSVAPPARDFSFPSVAFGVFVCCCVTLPAVPSSDASTTSQSSPDACIVAPTRLPPVYVTITAASSTAVSPSRVSSGASSPSSAPSTLPAALARSVDSAAAPGAPFRIRPARTSFSRLSAASAPWALCPSGLSPCGCSRLSIVEDRRRIQSSYVSSEARAGAALACSSSCPATACATLTAATTAVKSLASCARHPAATRRAAARVVRGAVAAIIAAAAVIGWRPFAGQALSIGFKRPELVPKDILQTRCCSLCSCSFLLQQSVAACPWTHGVSSRQERRHPWVSLSEENLLNLLLRPEVSDTRPCEPLQLRCLGRQHLLQGMQRRVQLGLLHGRKPNAVLGGGRDGTLKTLHFPLCLQREKNPSASSSAAAARLLRLISNRCGGFTGAVAPAWPTLVATGRSGASPAAKSLPKATVGGRAATVTTGWSRAGVGGRSGAAAAADIVSAVSATGLQKVAADPLPPQQDYSAESIRVLEGLEPVRLRPGMYIGSTDAEGLHHLVWEALDNATDEIESGGCRHVRVGLSLDRRTITVEDDGRGIPCDMHPQTGVSALETVFTKLHAGGKFGPSSVKPAGEAVGVAAGRAAAVKTAADRATDGGAGTGHAAAAVGDVAAAATRGGGYGISGGLHGVGISVLNALSAAVAVWVLRSPFVYHMQFSRGKVSTALQIYSLEQLLLQQPARAGQQLDNIKRFQQPQTRQPGRQLLCSQQQQKSGRQQQGGGKQLQQKQECVSSLSAALPAGASRRLSPSEEKRQQQQRQREQQERAQPTVLRDGSQTKLRGTTEAAVAAAKPSFLQSMPPEGSSGTFLAFTFDEEIFGEDVCFNSEQILERLRLLAYLQPRARFSFKIGDLSAVREVLPQPRTAGSCGRISLQKQQWQESPLQQQQAAANEGGKSQREEETVFQEPEGLDALIRDLCKNLRPLFSESSPVISIVRIHPASGIELSVRLFFSSAPTSAAVVSPSSSDPVAAFAQPGLNSTGIYLPSAVAAAKSDAGVAGATARPAVQRTAVAASGAAGSEEAAACAGVFDAAGAFSCSERDDPDTAFLLGVERLTRPAAASLPRKPQLPALAAGRVAACDIFYSFANNIQTPEGGVHVDGARAAIMRAVQRLVLLPAGVAAASDRERAEAVAATGETAAASARGGPAAGTRGTLAGGGGTSVRRRLLQQHYQVFSAASKKRVGRLRRAAGSSSSNIWGTGAGGPAGAAGSAAKSFGAAGEYLREGLVGVLSVKLKDPEFEGQTKKKLRNKYVRAIVEEVVTEGLIEYFSAHPTHLQKLLQKAAAARAAAAAARAARDFARETQQATLRSTVLPGKLADCTPSSVAERRQSELFIVEGESAAGTAKQARDRRTQAVLPLRGKILNVEKLNSTAKLLQNSELRALLAALGSPVSKTGAIEYDSKSIRYSRLILLTDADVDGAHVRSLLLTFFYRFQRSLIETNALFVAQPPLFKVSHPPLRLPVSGQRSSVASSSLSWNTLTAAPGKRGHGAAAAATRKATAAALGPTTAPAAIPAGGRAPKIGRGGQAEGEEKKGVANSGIGGAGLVVARAAAAPNNSSVGSASACTETYVWSEEQVAELLQLLRQQQGMKETGAKGSRCGRLSAGVITSYHEPQQKTELLGEEEDDNTGAEAEADAAAAHADAAAAKDGVEPLSTKRGTQDREGNKDGRHCSQLHGGAATGTASTAATGERGALPSGQLLPRGVVIQRFKGLGEMLPEQLWRTTMNPETRLLKQVTIQDAQQAEEMVASLMGSDVQARKRLIAAGEANSFMNNLDF